MESFVAEAEWNEELREECDVVWIVEDPINVVFLVEVEPLLVDKDAKLRDELVEDDMKVVVDDESIEVLTVDKVFVSVIVEDVGTFLKINIIRT